MTLEILPFSDEATWLQHRRAGIGSSEAPALLGESPWMTKEELFLQKSGRHTPTFDRKSRARMQAGNDLEAAVALKTYREHPQLFRGMSLYDPERAIQRRQFGRKVPFWLTCTVDRLLVPELHTLFAPHLSAEHYPGFHILELKTSSLFHNVVPRPYMIQVQHQLLVTGCKRGYVGCLSVEGGSRWDSLSKAQVLEKFAGAVLSVWEIPVDEEIHREILQEAETLIERVQSQ